VLVNYNTAGAQDSGYLTKFSTLMRQVLENSEEEKISLQEEISMLENYMQLEALRLPNGFDYEILLDKNIDGANTMIPPLILQPMVENAIWHGLMQKEEKGKLWIRFFKEDEI
jgi:LytS/YehU family sensor histidine kinase